MRFETLIEQYHDEIFGYLWRMARGSSLSDPRAEAEDLAQEVFLRAYRSFERLRPDSNPRAWLYKIATNCAYTALKRGQRHSDRSASLPEDGRLVADGKAGPYQVVSRREALDSLRLALDRLPGRQRMAVVLRHLQGLAYSEIAEALGCSEDSARAHVYQGVKRLRATVGDQGLFDEQDWE